MRIINLEFYAFGPYPGKVEIDFVPINERQLFLITGPTGSGKTTIFDAIAFALFSQPSGSYRDKTGQRSHLCKTNDKTYVKLTFEISDNRYVITRYPQQELLDRNGNLTTKVSEAYLTLPNGELVEGVRKVDEELSSILKLSASQFKQIVMLAQGEFRELLFASSRERGEIFRVIFGTEDLKKFTDILAEETKKVQALKDSICQEIDITCKNLSLTEPKSHLPFSAIAVFEGKDPLLEHLEIEIKASQKEMKDIEQQNKDLTTTIENVKVEKQKKENDNQLIDELKENKEQYSLLKLKEPEIKKDQLLIEKIKNIPYVETFEKAYYSHKEEISLLHKTFGNDKKDIADNKLKLKQYQDELSKTEKEISTFNKIWNKKNLTFHEKNIGRYLEYDQIINKYKISTNKIEKINVDYENVSNNKKEKDELLVKYENKQENYLTEINNEANIKEQLHTLQNFIKNLTRILEIEQSLRKNIEMLESLKKQKEEAGGKYRQLKDELAIMELSYSNYQAGVLAAELKPGAVCPVCGSTEHPKKATFTDPEISKEKIDIQKEICSKQYDRYNQILIDFNATTINQDTLQKELKKEKAEFNIDTNNTHNLLLEKQAEHTKIKEKSEYILELKKEFISLTEKIKQLKSEIKTLTEEQNCLNSLKVSEETLAKELKNRIANIEKELPENYENANHLKSYIEDSRHQLRELEESLQKTKDAITELKATIKEGENSLEKDKLIIQRKEAELNVKKAKFDEVILEKFDSKDDYDLCKKQKDDLNELEVKCNKYHEDLNKLKTLIDNLEKRTQGKVYADLKIFDEKINKHTQAKEALRSKRDQLLVKYNNNKEGLSNLKILYKEFLNVNNQYEMLFQLDKSARGDNEYKLDFERYILASYFDNILKSATIKLKEMTGMRYQFEKREGKAKGRAQQGLDINIFDNYTGKERDVKTLSGGELFKASLALALGLSDIIQQNAGGISINTLFIDEGFGSLDSESLDSALQTLTDIQAKGKIIGIISHVQEVKDRFSTKIMIGTSQEGSYIEKITI